MDPISAVGLASAVVQFVQFASTLVRGTHEIYKSSEGVSQGSLELDQIYSRLFGLSSHLAGRTDSSRSDAQTLLGSKSPEDDLNQLASTCEAACADLLRLVEKLRVSDGKIRLCRSFKAAMKEVLKQTELRKLQQRIDRLKFDMMLHVSVIS